MKKDIKLYNVLFPIWFFFFFPQVWLVISLVNFIVDSLVVYFSARRQQIAGPGALWKKYILPVWGIGFLCDFLGAILVGLTNLCWVSAGLDEIPLLNPILFPGTTLISVPGVILAGFLIFFLNKELTFRGSDFTPEQIHKLCLHLALWTAPYTMLIPIYG